MRTNLRRNAPDDAGRGTPARAERDAERLRIARELQDALTAGLNEVIVETVAAQQAVVRAAHADDVLLRLRNAEEGAHTAMADLRRLVSVYESVLHGTDA
ncbi:MAG TPA: histidine kinase [Micromonosporaceae bacterium]|nr:histidine kinase [Micromonosporaceae bacterium]